MDPLDTLGALLKANPPPGFSAVPNSKKGGYRKKVGDGYQYWYPDGAGSGASTQEPGDKPTQTKGARAIASSWPAAHQYVRRAEDGKGGWDYHYRNRRGEAVKVKVRPHPAVPGGLLTASAHTGREVLRMQEHAEQHALEAIYAKSKKTSPEHDFGSVPQRTWISSVEELGLPKSTQAAYKKGGDYTPERKAFHERVFAKFLDHVPPVPANQKPVAVVMMGGSAAGKGTVVRHVLGDAQDFVNVNPDDAKEELPEYQQAIDAGKDDSGAPKSAKDAAAMAHEESSDIAEEIRKRAVKNRQNLVLDGTGKDAKKHAAKIQELKDAGYHVQLLMPHVDMAEAQQRAKDRAQRSGRYVPDAFVEMAHHLIPGNFEEIAKHADTAVLFDNRKPPPRPVMTVDSGKQNVLDQEFVDEFRAAGKQRHEAARQRGWMKSWADPPTLRKADGGKPPSVSLEDLLKRFETNRGAQPDNATGIEDAEDMAHYRDDAAGESDTDDSAEAEGDDDMQPKKPGEVQQPGAAGQKPKGAGSAPQQAGAPGGKPGLAGPQGQAAGADGKPPKPAAPGEGKPGMPAQAGPDPEAGSVQYPTKVKNPETGEFEFVYLEDDEREEGAQFVVSPETAEGAHWELPHHDENYDAFKQWKRARKQGLAGAQIPKSLVDGAIKHAEKFHFDGGPHKAAFDDHQAHQGQASSPQAPPSHASNRAGGRSHPAMNGQDGTDNRPAKDPGKDAGKKPMVGKADDILDPVAQPVEGGVPSGVSRSGTEYATTPSAADEEADYERIYGLRRSMDPLDALGALGALEKASVPENLRKGLYGFDLSHGTFNKVPDNMLYAYLCSFIEEAHEHESREVEHRNPVAGEDFYTQFAMPVLHELVQYIPKNQNLARAADKFKVTIESIADIMKQKGLIKPPTDGHHDHGDYWSHDWDSMTAMGINDRTGPSGEVLMVSDARYNLLPDLESTRELPLQKGPRMVSFAGNQPTVIENHTERSRLSTLYRDQPVQVNQNRDCLIHSSDIHKQQISHQASSAKCCCPR